MPIEINILTGARAGAVQRFNQAVIVIGRHASSDLRFHPEQDLDVSGRHAEIRGAEGRYSVFDQKSTNGTLVNGKKVDGSLDLKDGDRIKFGAQGPEVEVRITVATDPSIKQSTEIRVAVAVKQQTAGLKRAMIAAVVLLVVGTVAVIALTRRHSFAQVEQLQQQIAASDSMIAELQGSMGASVDTALVNGMRRTIDALQQRLPSASADERAQIEREIAEHQRQVRRMDQMDLPTIHRNNSPAVAIIISDIGGRITAGSGFSISADGVLLTNRHNVRDSLGRTASRIAVKFTNTRDWLPATVLKVSDAEDEDLALIQMSRGSSFPAVTGVSATSADATEGMSVVTIGYPLGYDTPMEGEGNDFEAKSTLNPGTVSKKTSSVLQIDSYATHGSSGSPVFSTRGLVVGVVYGGQRDAGGKIVYAVPPERLAAFLPTQYKSIIRD